MSQNVWELKGPGLNRQKRRAQCVCQSLRESDSQRILDIGCAEGYATNFISRICKFVVGIEIDIEYLRIAKTKVKQVSFINASITALPFRDRCFDGITILEVLEHLNHELQRAGLKEADRVLQTKGELLISVPYNEQIIHTRCIHCKKLTPLYGHLHTLDESKISALLQTGYKLISQDHLPNLQIISCSNILAWAPFRLWYYLNRLLGGISKGYWIILMYIKN